MLIIFDKKTNKFSNRSKLIFMCFELTSLENKKNNLSTKDLYYYYKKFLIS